MHRPPQARGKPPIHPEAPLHLALYQPDIPQNAGTILRLGACLGVPVHVIGPAGFDLSDARLKRAGMDYLDHVALTRHVSWSAFAAWRGDRRLVLLTTGAETRAAASPSRCRMRPTPGC